MEPVGFTSLAFAWGMVTLVLCGLLMGCWAVAMRIRNAGIADVAWTFVLAGCGVAYAVLGPGDSTRRLVVFATAVAWGLRLGVYLWCRVVGKPEEGRYVELRSSWGSDYGWKMFGFFQLQALVAAIMGSVFLFPAWNPSAGFSMLEIAGLITWGAGMAGVSVSDAQLAAFKRKPGSHGRTCREGLWNYSRHPNYFFEFVLWCGWGMVALAAPYGWVGVLCGPVLLLFFILRVTGIPATEAQALRSKGDDYRDYQRTTSAFIPWFPRRIHP